MFESDSASPLKNPEYYRLDRDSREFGQPPGLKGKGRDNAYETGSQPSLPSVVHPIHLTSNDEFADDLVKRGCDMTRVRLSPSVPVAEQGPCGASWADGSLKRKEVEYLSTRKLEVEPEIDPIAGRAWLRPKAVSQVA